MGQGNDLWPGRDRRGGSERIRVALAGNPNVGKTTVFNLLTGARQHVGNYPGVTVELKEGHFHYAGHKVKVVDLPGTYSLSAASEDEAVARRYLLEESPDVVVQVAEAHNLERNLYLTTQLMELDLNIVLVLNMWDESEAAGDVIDVKRLEQLLGMPVVPMVATCARGKAALLEAIHALSEERRPHRHIQVRYPQEVEERIAHVQAILQGDEDLATAYPPRYLAVALLEGDRDIRRLLRQREVWRTLGRCRREGVALEQRHRGDGGPEEVRRHTHDVRDAEDADVPGGALPAGNEADETELAILEARYRFAHAVAVQAVVRGRPRLTITDAIDRAVTDRYLGIPVFLAMMYLAFQATFDLVAPLADLISSAIDGAAGWVEGALGGGWLGSLVGNGVIGGVGAVLVFVPNIAVLYIILALLDASGYLARAAFVMDRLLYRLGLHGRAFIPMLVGFGCNVPAILATRVIPDRRTRLTAILVNPLMSCSARLPVYILLAGTFFPHAAGAAVFSMYLLGIVLALGVAAVLRRTLLRGPPAPFIMEMPPYRFPRAGDLLLDMWGRLKHYLYKAGTVILAGAVGMWALASLPWGIEYGSAGSYAGRVGLALAPLFSPLGWDWRAVVALIFGFVAKEVVVSASSTLFPESGGGLESGFDAVSAYAFMAFTLVYVPCIATIAAIRKETNSWAWTLFAVVYLIALAYLVALVITWAGRALFGGG